MTVGLTGVPVVHAPPKDRSIPFPCQDSACGCHDAESCWRSCCCHSHAYRAAWSLQRGIQPPLYVLEKAAQETAQKSCCASRVAQCGGKGCSAKGHSDQDLSKPSQDPATVQIQDDALSVLVVYIDNYRKCRGLSPLWTVLEQALAVRVEMPTLPPLTAGEWLPCVSETVPVAGVQPEPPPPRRTTFFG